MIVRDTESGGVEVLAPAKLNLFLEILGKRPDGYHELESLMVAVDLFDTLAFADDPSGAISLTCDDPSLPTDSSNLVVRAAERLKAEAGVDRGARDRPPQGDPGAGRAGGRVERRGGDPGGPGSALGGWTSPRNAWSPWPGRSAATWPSSSNAPAAVCRGRGERVEKVASWPVPSTSS